LNYSGEKYIEKVSSKRIFIICKQSFQKYLDNIR